MPELREGIATALWANKCITNYKEQGSPMEITGLSSDMTGKEEARFHATNGLVRTLDGKSTCKLASH